MNLLFNSMKCVFFHLDSSEWLSNIDCFARTSLSAHTWHSSTSWYKTCWTFV